MSTPSDRPPTPLTPLKPALDERELITARYSEPAPGLERVYRTVEIVYPATATDDEIWERASRAIFGVECLRAAARQLDLPAPAPGPGTAPNPPADAPATSPAGAVRLADSTLDGSHAPRPGGTITDKQLKAIYAIGRAARHLSEPELDARCQELYHCRPSELSKVDASSFIDVLKGEQAA